MDNRIDQGLFGGIVVLGPCDRPPRRFWFPWDVLRPIFLDIERLERRPVQSQSGGQFLERPGPQLESDSRESRPGLQEQPFVFPIQLQELTDRPQQGLTLPLIGEADRAPNDPPRIWNDLEYRQGGDALAATALPDDAERLPRLDVKGDPVDGLEDALVGEEVGL